MLVFGCQTIITTISKHGHTLAKKSIKFRVKMKSYSLKNASKTDSLVFLKCLIVTWSMGKKLTVALYSGHMLAMVVRSGADSWDTPGPKNSTNFPAIPACLKCWKMNTQNTLVHSYSITCCCHIYRCYFHFRFL